MLLKYSFEKLGCTLLHDTKIPIMHSACLASQFLILKLNPGQFCNRQLKNRQRNNGYLIHLKSTIKLELKKKKCLSVRESHKAWSKVSNKFLSSDNLLKRKMHDLKKTDGNELKGI